jgi:DNA-directed RNA polymerase sigma subunit (sigma70/sigma32)
MDEYSSLLDGYDAAVLYVREIRKVPDLDKEHEKKLLQLAKTGDKKAIDKLIEPCLKKTIPIAIEYYKRKPKTDTRDLLDLLLTGSTGLLRAGYELNGHKVNDFWRYASGFVHREIEIIPR